MTTTLEKLPPVAWLPENLPLPPATTHQIIDASKMKTFMECPRKFFYEYLLGWRSDRPNNHLIFGQAWHLAMEHMLLNGYGEDSIYDAFLAFQVEYRKTFTEDTDEIFSPKTPVRAFEALAHYAARYGNDLNQYEVLHTEVSGKVTVAEGVGMYFRMDSILRNLEDGKIVSFEHKTGSQNSPMWQNQWALDLQPSLYNHVLYCSYDPDTVKGVIINGTFFKKVKDNTRAEKYDFQRVEAFKSRKQMNAWFQSIKTWLMLLHAEYASLAQEGAAAGVMTSFPMNTTSCTKYFGCQYHDFCCSWPNPLAKVHQGPPPGMTVDHWDPTAQESKMILDL